MQKITYTDRLKGVWSSIRNILYKVNIFLEQRPYLRTFLVFCLFFIVFFWTYFSVSPLITGDDHFFHFRFAEIMRHKGFFESFKDFKSIYFSKMAQGNQYFIYYNFLFYLLIIPFTYITPLYLGIKLYAVFAAAIVFTMLYYTARFFKIHNAFLWTMLVFALFNYTSIWRLLLSRPYVLAPAFLLILLMLFHKKQYIWIGILSFLYLYWYNASFFFPLILAIAFYVSESIYYRRNGDWKIIASAFCGVAVAVVFSYFLAPNFLLYMRDIILGGVVTVNKKVFIPEGTELYPISFYNYINSNIIVFSFFIMAIAVEVYSYIKFKFSTVDNNEDEQLHIRWTLFLMSLCFLAAALIVSGRFADYLISFAGLYLILILSNLQKKIIIADTLLQKSLFVGLIVLISYLSIANILAIQQQIANYGAPAETFSGVGQWLNQNTKKGDVIFNTSWNWFPQLYYYSPNNNYVVGIEPRFLYTYNEHLYWLWLQISNFGFVCDVEECAELRTALTISTKNPESAAAKKWYQLQGDAIAKIIVNEFHSTYILSSYEYTNLNNVLENNSHFKKVYGGNRAYYIYKITN